jgi:hypothetical protein
MQDLISRIFSIQSEHEFNQCALEVYAFQKENSPVYSQYLKLLNRKEPTHYSEIPHLPIGFFKSHAIIANGLEPAIVFKSSGTTGMIRSQHMVADLSLYERSFFSTYEHFVGPLANQVIVALLPNYVEQGSSSLVYMVEHLIQATNHPDSGFYLADFESLIAAIYRAKNQQKQVVLFGVSYALLDLAAACPNLEGVTIIETGGMKGKREDMSKESLHARLKEAFNCTFISSEYGMCELLSQAYSDANGVFELPVWMKIQLREVNDPLSYTNGQKTGGVNVIDLANIYSCSFIETQDLGRLENGKLRLMGRFDHSEVRGCNLLVQ